MRFPSKKAFVRASLLLIFALPTVAHAETPEEKSAREAKEAIAQKSHFLTLAEAQKAFGPDFSLEDKSGTFTLFGGTSEACLASYDISNDPKKGEFKIFYKGDNDTCLKFDDAVDKKVMPKGKFRSLSDLADAKMKPVGTFDLVNLVSENETSSKNPWTREELKTDKDQSLKNVAAEDVAKKKKKDAEDKKQAAIDNDIGLVTKCHRGLSELEIGDEALARLFKIKDAVLAKDDTKDAKWFSETEKKFQSEKFEACSREIKKAKTDELKSAKCETTLSKLILADKATYLPKVKKLMMEMVNRYMNSTLLSLEDAYAASIDTIAKIRALDLTDDEIAKLDTKEREVNIHFLKLAAAKGSGSEEFLAMQDNVREFMLAGDAGECLDEKGMIIPAQAFAPACKATNEIADAFNKLSMYANSRQMDLNNQALTQDCLGLRNDATSKQTSMNALDAARCKAPLDLVDAAAKVAANGSLNTAGNGFGTINSAAPTTTNSATNTNATGNSGFMNSGYPQNTATTNTSTATTPKVNTVQNVSYRIYK